MKINEGARMESEEHEWITSVLSDRFVDDRRSV